MGTIETTSKSLKTQANYTGEGLKINVNYTEDAITSTLKSLNGSIYKASDNTYVGEFDGQRQGDDVQYNTRNVKSEDMAVVSAALLDMQSIIVAAEQPQPNAE